MNHPARELYPSNWTEELWIIFDCRGPGAKNRFRRERRAWGATATVENLGHGRVVLVVRTGGALELAR
jgi:hypothetical protein